MIRSRLTHTPFARSSRLSGDRPAAEACWFCAGMMVDFCAIEIVE